MFGSSLRPTADAVAAPSRVIIVDDEAALSTAMARYLRRHVPAERRLQVSTASAPREALALVADAATGEPLVVISDFDLRADMDGVDLLSEVSRRAPHARRVLMSGRSRSELDAALERAGPAVETFLPKPFELEDVKRLVLGLSDPGAPR